MELHKLFYYFIEIIEITDTGSKEVNYKEYQMLLAAVFCFFAVGCAYVKND